MMVCLCAFCTLLGLYLRSDGLSVCVYGLLHASAYLYVCPLVSVNSMPYTNLAPHNSPGCPTPTLTQAHT